jgi:hypothetical protein
LNAVKRLERRVVGRVSPDDFAGFAATLAALEDVAARP